MFVFIAGTLNKDLAADLDETDQKRAKNCTRVIKESEEPEFEDLGLGRGVDATNPTPWLNKRPLLVRAVDHDDIIGTEEGNLYQCFVNEVESTQHFQTSLSASVPANQLVSLGIDSELSRSYSVSRKSVGRKIITRTISFRANFDRSCKYDKSFERRLTNWIAQHRKVKEMEGKIKEELERGSKMDDTQVTNQERKLKEELEVRTKIDDAQVAEQEREELEHRAKANDKQVNDQERKIKEEREPAKVIQNLSLGECFDLCYDFISTFSVTHYVHSLELGASHYRVMTLEEYTTKYSSKAKLGAGPLAAIALGSKKSSKRRKYKLQTTKVGRMKLIDSDDDDNHDHSKLSQIRSKKDDEDIDSSNTASNTVAIPTEEEVKRGTIEEAVVGVKLQPISSLVSNVKLRVRLQQALQKYIHDKQKVKCKYIVHINLCTTLNM